MNPPNALAHKGEVVEEWVDLKFFRPLGMRIARLLAPTEISPDQVTLWSILIGLVAGHLFVYRDKWVNLLGVLLFIISDVFDSADGQLARLRGKSTKFGRALDGIGDNVRFINLYVHLAIRMWLASWGWTGLWFVALGAVSHSLQSTAVDFIRNAFVAAGLGNNGELDLPEDVAGPLEGNWFERLGRRIYRGYVRRQAWLFPRTVRLARWLRSAGRPESWRSEYRQRVQPFLPLCAWLGTNIRFALLAVVALDSRPSFYMWTTATAMNAVLVLLVAIQEYHAAGMLDEVDGGYVRIR